MTERRTGSPEIGTRVLLENERVKIWDFVLEPGESFPMHTHRRDHVIVVVEGGRLDVEDAVGNRRTVEPNAGDHFYIHVDGEDTHDAQNVGPGRYRNLIIELKEPRR
jgi:quercetin dioxygenase-like cupin family protein